MDVTLIVAVDRQNGIGIDNTIPWRLKEDMAFFKQTTTGNTIIMGRKTWDSLGRPLPNRRSIVITRDAQWQAEGAEAAHSLDEALALAASGPGQAFVIGGGQIYAEALPRATRLLVTEIDADFRCDAHFPAIDRALWRETARTPHHSEANGFDYAFVTYERS